MSTNLEILQTEVLKPTPADRLYLLERLVACLDVDTEVEAAWEMEAELESGSAVEVPGLEAIARLRAKLSR